MIGGTLAVLAEVDDAGETILRAPKVGVWSAHPENGALVGAGSTVGMLTQLHRRFALVIPEGVAGRVAIEDRRDRTVPVGYGEVLCRLARLAGKGIDAASIGAPVSSAPEGALHVASPTDGVYYRSPSPDARPFVVAGDRVKTGQPLGLIEVMKTFNPIAYGGAGLPDDAEVVEVLAGDGQEVRAGQPLVVVKTL